jgi:hypothetical protein
MSLFVLFASTVVWATDDIGTIKWNTDGYYEIDSEEDLEVLAHYVNGTSDQHSDNHPCDGLLFKLTQDITMIGEHVAIGTLQHQFKGMFDGCGYTITNLTITDEGYMRGLFGHLNCSSEKDQNNKYYPVYVKNVTLQNCNLNGTSYVGGIAGRVSSNSGNNVKIENCHVLNANITASGEYQYIGGIVGQAYAADITDCTSTGTVTAGSHYCGGIIGYHSGGYGHITSCESSVTIKGNAEYGAGIVGHWDGESDAGNLVTDCFFIGTIEAEITYYGAIAGYIRWNNFSNNYYASPCNVKGCRDYDWSGKYEVSYALKLGEGITAITPTETPAHHSVLTGFDYFKASTVHLTLNHEDAPAGYHFAAYTCNGDIMIADGEGKYPVTLTDHDVTIAALYAKDDAVQMSATSVAAISDVRWTGVAVEPAPVVTYNSTELTAGTDYLVDYTDNINPGTATVTLTGIGNYTGTTTKTFEIKDFPLVDEDPTHGNSATNPYKIETEEDLRALASIVNNNARRDGYYKQVKNIELTKEHVAIGNNSRSFRGTYDGDNKKISGLVINKPDKDFQGLFGVTYDATIKNVVIDNCDITALSYAAGIVGEGNGNTTVSYCKVSGEIRVSGKSGYDVAGIAGRANNVDHCVNTASVTGNGTDSRYIGGIVGYAYGSISNCFNAGVVSGGTSYVGSIIGQSAATLTNNCHTTATTGGVGAQDVTTGTDQTGAEVAVKISAGTGVTLTLPDATYEWNSENLYKSGTVVTLDYAVPNGKFFDYYTVNSGEISKNGVKEGEHVLTGFTQDVTISGNIVDSQTDFTGVVEIADIADLTFNGQVHQPQPVVTYNSETLVKDTHYTVSYSGDCQNAGQYTITVTGIGHYKGTAQKTFNIAPYDISGDNAVTVAGFDTSYGKTGFAVHPTPAEVKCPALNNAILVLDTDYELLYSDGCILPGNYQVTINGKGNYKGSKALDFTILNTYGLTVHNGLTTNDRVPIYGFYADGSVKSEFVMPAAELSAMNGKDIYKLSFYLKQKASKSWGNARFQVFLKEVDFTSFSSTTFNGNDGATIVYEGALDGTQNVMNIEFTTPYKYHGGNLLVGVYQSENGSYSPVSFYGESVTGASLSKHGSYETKQHDFLPKTTFWYGPLMTLADNAMDNSTTISNNNGETGSVKLEDRTLYKDGDWNTLCLPFDVSTTSGPLAGDNVVAMTLNTSESNLTGSTFTLSFDAAPTTIPAGTPFIIKWATKETPATNLVSPVFTGVTIDNTMHNADFTGGTFKGTYERKVWNEENKSILFVGTNNTLYWPTAGGHVNACRAYFDLGTYEAREFVLNFDDQTTGVIEVKEVNEVKDDSWYTLNGVKLSGKPTKSGLYIHGNRKVVIK